MKPGNPMSSATEATGEILTARGLSKDFFLLDRVALTSLLKGDGDWAVHRALDDIDLSVGKGEIVGLLGHNGAGKSTLLRTLGGVYEPTSGTVAAAGDITAIYELGVASNEFMTGRQYALRCFQQMAGESDNLQAYLDEVRAFAEIGEHFDKSVRSYSAGMKARLFFAVATSFERPIFLIDEVLSVGDNYFRGRCWRRMRELKKRGVSGLLATHDWSSVLKLGQRCYVIEKGRISRAGASFDIVQAYLGFEDKLTRTGVRFCPDLPTEYHITQFADLTVRLPVEADSEVDVLIGVSIESVGGSAGWENVVLVDPVRTSLSRGRCDVVVNLPELPIAPGTYLLHAFILRREVGSGEIIEIDARTWYHGNPLKLIVSGEPSEALVSFRPSVKITRRTV